MRSTILNSLLAHFTSHVCTNLVLVYEGGSVRNCKILYPDYVPRLNRGGVHKHLINVAILFATSYFVLEKIA